LPEATINVCTWLGRRGPAYADPDAVFGDLMAEAAGAW
jgi:hypothetical protein